MGTVFSALAVFLFAQSLVALMAGVRLARYVWRSLSVPQDRYAPKTVVIIPCKGIDPDFKENIVAYLAQDYLHYELIFVTEGRNDPACQMIEEILNENDRSAWLITAGESQNCGQKVHNLCVALDLLDSLDRKAEVIVFADSDTRPEFYWLREMINPLSDRRIGATTGFRWYLAPKGGFFANLLSVWNASALNLLGERSAFAWGGAMAMNRDVFEALQIRQRWQQGAVSDDYVLTQAIQSEGLKIKFVPQCLVPSTAMQGWKEVLEFTTRQIIITRIYAPRLWWLTLFTHLFFNLAFWGGLISSISGWAKSEIMLPLLLGIFILGAMAGGIRGYIAFHLLSEKQQPQIQRNFWSYLFLHPLVSLLYLHNLFVSIGTRKILWRGIGYEMFSPKKTIIWWRQETSHFLKPSESQPQHSSASAQSKSMDS